MYGSVRIVAVSSLKRYSKYNTTQTRTITQFYHDKSHKKPIGDKAYSKPIMS